MNYIELQNRVAGLVHRKDLTSVLPLFVEDARERLNRRFNLTLVPFVADTDTNDILTNFPLLYVYASTQAAFEYLNNGDNATYMAQSWERECDRQNVLQPYTAADNYTADNPPYIKTPSEQEYV